MSRHPVSAAAGPDRPPPVTHARGRWFYGVLVGVWPVALAIGALGVALGLPLGITLGSALAAALAVDFLTIVLAFEVDDGDPDDALDDVAGQPGSWRDPSADGRRDARL